MLVIVKDNYGELSTEAAQIIVSRLRRKPNMVLGLPTGSTPLGLYNELIRLQDEEGLDFSKITTFNLDEYVGLPPTHRQSYNRFMWEKLFNHLNIPAHSLHILDGLVTDIDQHCDWYEDEIRKVGGIDLQVLGIGANGHIAFNEPGSSLGSRTRVKTLTLETRMANARFFPNIEDVPKYALTMGVGTIMDAKEILLLANGAAKADAIAAAVEGPLTAQCPASIIQLHPKSFVLVDKDAGGKLTGSFPGSWKSSFLLDR
jgi:glucosamine-6-phosphate deaminase